MAMSFRFPASDLDIVKSRYAKSGQSLYYETCRSLPRMNGCTAPHADAQPIYCRLVLPPGNMKKLTARALRLKKRNADGN
jgi:hypothetical protein